MVGLVIVSHSRALANSLLLLVKQVASPAVPVAIAAGAGPDRTDFGTDAIEIMEAIQSVSSPEGVVVLMDLGSAVLSAQTAIDLLPPEVAGGVRLCAAPLVEGCVVAAVQAGLGSDVDTICREAEQSLLPKRSQVGEEEPEPERPMLPEVPGGFKQVFTLKNKHGLHARPAARFVQVAASFEAVVQVRDLTNQKGPVSARSLNSVATLGAVGGHQIEISASGLQAREVMDALARMVEDGFGETDEEAAQIDADQAAAAPLASGALRGLAIAEGVALGPLYHYRPVMPPVSKERTKDPTAERARLQRALETVAQAIRQRYQQVKLSLGKTQAAIFEAHQLIVQDPELQEIAFRRIQHKSENASLAWQTACDQVADSYRSLDDIYLRQRAADVMDVCQQVLFELAGRNSGQPALQQFDQPVVLFAWDLTPTETSQMALDKVLAILTIQGSSTSHAAILARSLGIPAVFGVDENLLEQPDGALVAVDGFNGSVILKPDETQQKEFEARRHTWLSQRETLRAISNEPAHLRDGRKVEVSANIGGVKDAATAVNNGADGVGLLRTEFLFLTRQTPPTEDEQTEALSAVAQAMGKRAVIVRTLDVGGDKPLPYIQMPAEDNPFLGVRAIRLMQQRPDLFQTQLRAILRAALAGTIRIMVPMVANLDEVSFARQQLEQAHKALRQAGVAHAWPVEMGIMVEIPSAALLSRELAEQVDFFSIGTNDLTQYTMAAERGNPALTGLADALHPAVLRLIHQVVENAHACKKWVGVCGELAGDPLAAPVLVGLGVDELSMNPGGIPRVKALLRSLDSSTVEALAQRVLRTDSAPAARKLAREFADSLTISSAD